MESEAECVLRLPRGSSLEKRLRTIPKGKAGYQIPGFGAKLESERLYPEGWGRHISKGPGHYSSQNPAGLQGRGPNSLS